MSAREIYDKRRAAEQTYFSGQFRKQDAAGRPLLPFSEAKKYVEKRLNDRVRAALGSAWEDWLVDYVNSREHTRLLALGSGACGMEIALAERFARPYEFECTDINPDILEIGRREASAKRLDLRFSTLDLNFASLERGGYDLILSVNSLHHVVNLERLYLEVARALAPDGRLVVFDACLRDGGRLWPETLPLMRHLWAMLPQCYKINHASRAEPFLEEEFADRDLSVYSFECVRSAAVRPLLHAFFEPEIERDLAAFAWRLTEVTFGDNFDPERQPDRAILDFALELDFDLLDRGQIRAERFLGVYRSKPLDPDWVRYIEGRHYFDSADEQGYELLLQLAPGLLKTPQEEEARLAAEGGRGDVVDAVPADKVLLVCCAPAQIVAEFGDTLTSVLHGAKVTALAVQAQVPGLRWFRPPDEILVWGGRLRDVLPTALRLRRRRLGKTVMLIHGKGFRLARVLGALSGARELSTLRLGCAPAPTTPTRLLRGVLRSHGALA